MSEPQEQVKYDKQERSEPFETTHARFHSHAPSPEGASRHSDLSGAFLIAAEMVQKICPNGREKSLALTHLENAKFFASAAVARNPETR